jgi:hypothetical protein
MTSLTLKVKIKGENIDLKNRSDEDWDEMCIIFQKLIRNIKQEFPSLCITDFDKSQKSIVSMKVGLEDDSELTDDNLIYVFDYLTGHYTDNVVYIGDKKILLEAEVINQEQESFLDRFNGLTKTLE